MTIQMQMSQSKMKKILFLIIFFSVSISSLYSDIKIEEVNLKSAVVFNTLCAKCHEGQCSGRLSFDTGSESATNHIKRYCCDPKVSKVEVKEFFTLLNYMKKECSLFMPISDKKVNDKLSSFAIPSKKGYFIPLGILKSGEYTLSLQTKENIRFRIEIISSQFDSYLDQSVCPNDKEKIFDFEVDDSIDYFLRIRSKKALNLNNFEIKKND